MNKNYSFSNYLENRQLQEVAEYMTGDDSNIDISDSGRNYYVASHKNYGPILVFRHKYNFDTSLGKDGYDVSFYGDMRKENESKLLGSYLASITKFIKEYNPGTLDFYTVFKDIKNNKSKMIPLMQKSLKTIAMKNDMAFLNNKMLTKDALESLNRRTTHPSKGFLGIDDEKKWQAETDEIENKIRQDRMKNMMDKRSSIQQTKDFMAQQRSEYDAKKIARAERLAPKPTQPEPKKGFFSRMFGKGK